MALNTKAIKARIKSVKSTKKITKAMELVSAAKMRRAVAAALGCRAYAQFATELLDRFGGDELPSPLLQTRKKERALLVLISSNRGLCGSFNASILREAKQAIGLIDTPVDILGLGRRSVAFGKKHGYEVIAAFDALGDTPPIEDTLPVSHIVLEEFTKGVYDRVFVAYTHYRSSLVQEPRVRQLLPITKERLHALVDESVGGVPGTTPLRGGLPTDEVLLEPSPEVILSTVLPELVKAELYQYILESVASEHSARMMAMRNASDAAGDMMDELQLRFNKARQAAITQEIAEIAAGASAL